MSTKITKISTICPVCEKDIEIKTREIKLSMRHKKETGGKVLVSCPECCRALKLDDTVPTEESLIDSWVGEVSKDEDWCGCLPMLDPTQEKTPAGSYSDLGVTVYRPGGGGKALGKYPYMAKYGINPQCYMAKNPSMGKKPFKIGA